MFRFSFRKHLKAISTTCLLKRLQKPRSIQHSSSSVPKERNASYSFRNNKKINKMNKEVFFPQLWNEGVKDKVALVNKGTDGIGLRCVRELLKGGAKGVMIADTDETKGYKRVIEFSKDFGRERVAFIQMNPANYLLLKNAFLSTINHYKGIDIVINNVTFKEKNWEDQVDESIKGVVLSTQLCLEFMGRNNGAKGGILLNIASNYNEHAESCPLHLAVQDFIVKFDRSVASTHFNSSNVKVLTICQATLDSIGCDLNTIITKGPNGCVWKPSE